MILIIRISGKVNVPNEIEDALQRLNIHKKYSATILQENRDLMLLLRKIRDYIAYGEIKNEVLLELIKKRAQVLDKKKKVDAEKIVSELGKKSLKQLGLKPFFRLHPPRGGIESKKHAGVGKGVLGQNKQINELVEKML